MILRHLSMLGAALLLSAMTTLALASSSNQVVQIPYEDLKKFAENDDTDGSISYQTLVESLGNAFGPDGLGLLEVTRIPDEMVELRTKVLLLSRKLAELTPPELEEITLPEQFFSIGWSHGKEQFKGQYDLAKGSFYMDPFRPEVNAFPSSLQPELEDSLMKMTHFMAKVGLWVTRLCDVYVQQQNIPLEPSLLSTLEASVSAKARLLHYFPRANNDKSEAEDEGFDDWCGEHVDHGSLTALLPGMVLAVDDENPPETDTPTADDSSLSQAGLYIKTRSGEVVHAKLASTSLGFQIGETMSIQSRGRLQATPHAVKSAPGRYTRESLALFLQPNADEMLPPLDTSEECFASGYESDPFELASRWRPTFGEFQKETIAYYN